MKITGRPLRLTPDDIARLALVGDDDLRDARRAWRAKVPGKFRRLLSANDHDSSNAK